MQSVERKPQNVVPRAQNQGLIRALGRLHVPLAGISVFSLDHRAKIEFGCSAFVCITQILGMIWWTSDCLSDPATTLAQHNAFAVASDCAFSAVGSVMFPMDIIIFTSPIQVSGSGSKAWWC